MFLVHKRDIALDGSNPTMLIGYGGFASSVSPGFARNRFLWMEHGGVYAEACIRGGAEYGDAWHRAGMLDRKQNVFDDFTPRRSGSSPRDTRARRSSPCGAAATAGSWSARS